MSKGSNAMAAFENETVARAETVVIINHIKDEADAAERLIESLPAAQKRTARQHLVNIRSAADTLDESIRKLPPARHCFRCGHILTTDEAWLHRHIEEAADRAMQVSTSWPREQFVQRMREELAPGDEIIFCAVGRVTVLRASGRHDVIYQRER
jgi:hypothetical protein